MQHRAGWRLLIPLGLLAALAMAAREPHSGLTVDESNQLTTQVVSLYGQAAGERFRQWRQLVTQPPADEQARLEAANSFFNRQQTFVDDPILWQQQDYWATVPEFLGAGGGDCEDFAISKFFTLLEMGVDENKLRITYVKALKLNQFHMVLAYYPTPDGEPLILDNLINDIRRAGKRTDLKPIYGFNGGSLWLARAQGTGQRVGGSDKLGLWQSLRQRMLDRDWRVPPNFERPADVAAVANEQRPASAAQPPAVTRDDPAQRLGSYSTLNPAQTDQPQPQGEGSGVANPAATPAVAVPPATATTSDPLLRLGSYSTLTPPATPVVAPAGAELLSQPVAEHVAPPQR